NPDLAGVLTVSERPGMGESLALLRRIWRRYDLAVPTHTGDRPSFFAWAAGRHRLGFLAAADSGRWWKRYALDRWVGSEESNHRVIELSRLADALGLSQQSEIVCPRDGKAERPDLPAPYAVLHAAPMFRIRRWTDHGWRVLAQALAGRGLTIAVTGGPDPGERDYLDRLWDGVDPSVRRFDGALSWPELTLLLRNAAVYVGPDTSMTHLAAGAGAPTVALYGPASPSLMGPWPLGGLATPWSRAGTIQRRGNVWVVQNPLPCMPCDKLGCEGHLDSYSRCLDELPVQQVLAAVDQALSVRQTA
ncbi:MAG: glycosyltransferase family 9 protein, partial [Xanthobacteraceae bacterium]